MNTLEWKDTAWILGILSLVGGMLLAFLRFKLAGDFAPRSDMTAMSGRITIMEQRLAAMPSHDDLRGLQARIGGVEREVAVVGEKVNGATELIRGVAHQVGLLVEHQINEGPR